MSHYAKAVADLDEHDLSMLAAWHASLEVGHPVPNKEFLVNVFPSLGENRREALKIAAGFRGEEAFEAGVGEEQAFDTVLPWLSQARCVQLAAGVPRALLLGPARRRELISEGSAEATASRALAGQRRLDVGDRLLGGAKPDRAQPELAGGGAVELDVVEEQRLARVDAEALRG